MNQESKVFAKIMSLIARRPFNNSVARYKGNYLFRNFSCYDQFIVKYKSAQYIDKNGLSNIEVSLTVL